MNAPKHLLVLSFVPPSVSAGRDQGGPDGIHESTSGWRDESTQSLSASLLLLQPRSAIPQTWEALWISPKETSYY